MSSLVQTIDLVKQYLDLRVAGHAVHSANLANAETPHFQARIPEFKATLDQAIATKAHPSALQQSPWRLEMRIRPETRGARNDGNTVQLEQEMAAIAQNGIDYQTGLRIITKELAIAKYAIMSTTR